MYAYPITMRRKKRDDMDIGILANNKFAGIAEEEEEEIEEWSPF